MTLKQLRNMLDEIDSEIVNYEKRCDNLEEERQRLIKQLDDLLDDFHNMRTERDELLRKLDALREVTE